MEIYEFIANYPEINSDNFYIDIYKKKEFHELISDNESVYRSWQKIIARFISYWTLYRGLLICHDTGTGKSGTAIAVFEGMRRNGPLGVLYLTQNETLIDNFKNEIIYRSKYLKNLVIEETKDQDMNSESFKRARNRVLHRENFSFLTYATFSNIIQKKKETNPLETISNHLVIFDEVHHLVIKDFDEPNSPYQTIYNFLTTLHHKDLIRLLLLTATPMRHEPKEIAPLLNLILPEDDKLPTGDEFHDYFFNSSLNKNQNIPNLKWKPDKEIEFQKKIKGYVSVIKQNTDVKVEYIGKIYPPMKFYKLEINPMTEFQSQYYLKAWKKDLNKDVGVVGGKSAFKSNSQQASLFIFPDGSYGETGQKKYMSSKDESEALIKKKKGSFKDIFFKETGLKIGSEYDEENIEIISSMSIIYANIIQQILDNPTEHIYIYCDKINGSGMLVLTGLLRTFFQFSSLTNAKNVNWDEPKRRFLFLNEEAGIKESDFQDLLKIFNDERNIFADFCQVIIGTDKTKEGITLKRIRQIHITTPDWNFGKMQQAIGRGIRMFSHFDLDDDEKHVNVFFHCSVPVKEDELIFQDSVDFQLYHRSELRDQNIKLVEYNLLVSAFDCELNKKINDRSNFQNHSPECYYKTCNYICNGFEGVNTDDLELDYSSYDAYYAIEKLNSCVKDISSFLIQVPIIIFKALCEYFSDRYTERVVFETIEAMINNPIPVYYKNFKTLYVMRKEDIIFLIDDVTLPNDPFLTFYAINPSFQVSLPFEKILDYNINNYNILKIIKAVNTFLSRYGDYSAHIIKLLNILPLSHIENIILPLVMDDNDIDHPVLKFLRQVYFKDKLKKQDGVWVHFLNKIPKRFIDNQWVQGDILSFQTGKVDHDDPEFVKKYITDNPFKLYGFILNGNLKIRDVRDPEKIKSTDKKKETHGQECTFYKVKDLLEFLWILDSRFPSSMPENEDFHEKYKATKVLSNSFLTSLVKNKSSFLKFFKDKTIKNEQEAMRFFHYFHDMKRDLICKEIEKQFKLHNLIVPPPIKKK